MPPINRNKMPATNIKIGPPISNVVERKRLIDVIKSKIRNNRIIKDAVTSLILFKVLDDPFSTKFTETPITTEIIPRGKAIKGDRSLNSGP